MTHTWIVGLDGSDGSVSALRWAAELATRRNERVAPIAAWHVPFPIWLMSGRRVIDVDRAGIEAAVAVHAAEAIAALPDATAVDELRVVEGHPAPTLVEMAGPDTTVVVGRRGISELKHRLVGSVSQYLVTHSSGPVVVVPDEWRTSALDRIVVGFDGSAPSAAALQWALSVAPDDCEVEAIVAIDVVPWLAPELANQHHPDVISAARERVAEVADAIDIEGRAARRFVLDGPRHALAEVVGEADLVVVGPRGLGGLGRAVLGSVTTWLLHEATCPIAVVPEPLGEAVSSSVRV